MLSDIEQGVRGNPELCAVARAMRRAGLQDARAYVDYLDWIVPHGVAEISTPVIVREFIVDYDNRRPGVIPLRFRIDGAFLEMKAA